MFKFRNLSTRNFNDIFSGLFFLIPGVGLLIGFGIVPICLALYMSLFRWRPVQGRFVGFANYEKAIGDLTCGIIFILGILGLGTKFFFDEENRLVHFNWPAMLLIIQKSANQG